MSHVKTPSLLLIALLIAACGQEGDGTPAPSELSADGVSDAQVADAGPGSPDPDGSGAPVCPQGQIPGMDGACVFIGIPGCAELFMNTDSGFCEPSIDLCEPGGYPDFEVGCVQAGITDCAPEFTDPGSGLCAPGPDPCDPGFMAIPTVGCVSLDPPQGCGEGPWGSIVESPGDQHVDPGYTGGDSDGSRERPWTQISAAQDHLPAPGARVVLAAGDYDESVFFQGSSSLIGRCSSMVTVSGATQSPIASNLGKTVLEVGGPHEVTLRDLRVSGDGIGLAAYFGAQVTLERVVFEDNEFFGIFSNGTDTALTATDLAVRATRPQADGMFGLGVSVQDGAAFHLHRGVVAHNTDANLYCGGSIPGEPSELTLKDVLISSAQDASHGIYGGRGVSVDNGASATLENTIIGKNSDSHVHVDGPGTSVTAHGLVILGDDGSDSSFGARGVNLQNGATGQLNQVAIYRVEDLGLYMANDGTIVEASGLFIQETQPAGTGGEGRAVHLKDGASFSLDGGAFIANHDTGFMVRDGSTATVTGLLIEHTQPDTDGFGGTGLAVLTESQVVLERSALLTNVAIGVGVSNIADGQGGLEAATTVEVKDSMIAHTQASSDGSFGRGMVAQMGASLIVERSVIIDNYEAAILIWEASGDIRESLLADTHVSGDNQIGDGLLVTMSEVTASGVVATRNERVGVLYNRASGEISNCSISENGLGLATQGAEIPTVSDDNTVVDNTKNVIMNNALPIPDTPMALPKSDKTSNE